MRRSDTPRPFTVVVADNFHYMDEQENVEHGSFETLEAAIAAAKAIVDLSLRTAHRPGMTADELYDYYTSFGDDPFIRGGGGPGVPFSAWDYAKDRCAEICANGDIAGAGRHDV
jgi:hypothetical protein